MNSMHSASRRDFLKGALLGAAALRASGGRDLMAAAEQGATAKSRVVVARDALLRGTGSTVDSRRMPALVDRAVQAQFNRDRPLEAWKMLVHPGESVGLKVNTLGGCGISSNLQLVEAISTGVQRQDDSQFVVEAKFYQKQQNRKIKCKLCPRECVVGDKERGYCGARENRGGTYYSLVHSRVCAAHVDPVEKKPLFHYLPGTVAFSVATAGCNVNCKFCQNWDISQSRPEQIPAEYAPPKRVAEMAKQYDCPTIAYTYSEPVIFSEFLMDVADAGHDAGIRSVVVSNGYMQEESLKAAYGKMDAVKIDLKAFSEKYYRDVVTGQLKPVLESLVTLKKMGKWTEIVYLVLPGMNDGDEELRGLAKWVKTNLGTDVPLHFTQFHPQYLLKNLPITPAPTLERAKAIADAEGLHYVYIGNVPGHPAQNTYCPQCRKMLVERVGFTASQMLIRKGRCPFCQHPIPGVWHA